MSIFNETEEQPPVISATPDAAPTFEEFLEYLASNREHSVMEEIALLTDEEREKTLEDVNSEELLFDWHSWARPSQIMPTGDWSTAVILAGRGFGKAVALYTPIPTPTGWTTMGELRDGDFVLDDIGRPCRVVQAHEPYFTAAVYTLTFDDGSQIVADADHQWVTQTWVEYKRSRVTRVANTPGHRRRLRPALPTNDVRTTKEIVETLSARHSVQVARSLDLPETELPIEPYTFGAWLGDGASSGPYICGVDQEIFDRIAQHYPLRDVRSPSGLASKPNLLSFAFGSGSRERQVDGRFGANETGMYSLLKRIGVFKNKHIPQEYLRSSIAQRLALLQGLMDTDGYVDPNGVIASIGFVNKQLRDGVYELLVSLGYKARRNTKMKGVSGRPETLKPFYVVDFRPDPDRMPFYLSRKCARVVPYRKQSNRQHVRYVNSVEPAEPQVVRCITVNSPNSLYLAGESMIPTHNTRVGAEWIREKVRENPGCRITLLGRTSADVRDVMVNGESGIISVSPPSEKPTYIPSRRALEWENGSVALLATSVEPSVLRGPQSHFGWADEIATYSQIPDESGLTAFQNLRIGNRLGDHPQILATTTPKRVPALQQLLDEVERAQTGTILVRGRTVDNAANLSRTYLEVLWSLYAGSALWKQELEGVLLEDIEGALWSDDMINAARSMTALPKLPYRVVAVDPSVAEKPNDECGIVVVGATAERRSHLRHAYVLEDASLLGPPDVWAKQVVETAKKWRCPVVAEGNQGQALVKMAIQTVDPSIPVYIVNARQNKQTRAEPVAAAYAQKRVHHVNYLPVLESQMVTWEPAVSKKSPDRMDALVWGVTALMIKPPKGFHMGAPIRAASAARQSIGNVKKFYTGHRAA